MNLIMRFLDDILLILGCLCVLYGLSLWNVIATWIAGGVMLVGLAVLVGKAKAKHAAG